MLNLLSLTLLFLFSPILIPQAIWTRRRTPRLPEAAGPTWGLMAGQGEPFHMVILGESTAAGVGAPTYAEALIGQTASALARLTNRSIQWQALGRNGATARTVLQTQVPQLAGLRTDVVIIALGVNDTTRLHSIARWLNDLKAIISQSRQHVGPVPVVLAGIPPLRRFPALPQPLRFVIGLRAEAMDQAAAQLATSLPDVLHLPIQIRDTHDFASDGYHPGPVGYAAWGAQVAEAIAEWMVSG